MVVHEKVKDSEASPSTKDLDFMLLHSSHLSLATVNSVAPLSDCHADGEFCVNIIDVRVILSVRMNQTESVRQDQIHAASAASIAPATLVNYDYIISRCKIVRLAQLSPDRL